MRPKNYREQDGCYNCTFCKVEEDYNMPILYFCEYESKMPEYNSEDKNKDVIRIITNFNVYFQWRISHEVVPWGVCDAQKQH